MSDDLIRRSDAIKAVENVSENYTKEGDREWHPHIDFITQALVQVPSVSPKHGEWKPFDHTWGRSIYSCSVCEESTSLPCGWHDGKPIYTYCPFCGAKMTDKDIDVPYKIASDQRDYDSTYEPTYNEQDGSM